MGALKTMAQRKPAVRLTAAAPRRTDPVRAPLCQPALLGLLVGLVVGTSSTSLFAQGPQDDPGWAKRATKVEAGKTSVRFAADTVNDLLRQFSSDETVRRQVAAELNAAADVLVNNASAAAQFWGDLRKVQSRDALRTLVEQKRLRAYAASLIRDHADGLAGKGDDVLRRIVAHSDEGLDEAGREALTLLRQAETQLASTGRITRELDEKLVDVLAKLPPERALAGQRLVRNQLAARGVSGFDMFMRTGVDALFVAGDILGIAALDSPQEKAARSSGTLVTYGLETGANVAVRALGGGLFLHGLVVSLSAAAVGELTSEIIQLHYDRQNAAIAEQQAALAMRASVLQGLLRTDELIKAGKLAKARSYLGKLRAFYATKDEPDSWVLGKLLELDRNIEDARDLLQANRIIAEARVHYNAGYGLARQGRQLRQAREHMLDARKILEEGLAVYPMLRPALDRTNQVIGLIERLIAEAPTLQGVDVSGPTSAPAGEWVSFILQARGGAQDFSAVGIESTPLAGGAIASLRAPSSPGMHTLEFTLRDHLGRSVRAQAVLNVQAAERPDWPQPPADTPCERTVFEARVTHADRARTEFSFLLMPRDEVVRLAQERASKPLQEHEIERLLTQTYRSSMPDDASQAAIAAAMPRHCHTLLTTRQLFIMWHGTRTEINAAGSTRYQAEFRQGYRVRTLVEHSPEPTPAGQPVGGVPVGGGFAPR